MNKPAHLPTRPALQSAPPAPHPYEPPRLTGKRPLDQVTPFYRIDNAAILRRFSSWCRDDAVRKMILVDNPAKLYRFT